jgi:branched-chain amino acid transport system substrate-binding protein
VTLAFSSNVDQWSITAAHHEGEGSSVNHRLHGLRSIAVALIVGLTGAALFAGTAGGQTTPETGVTDKTVTLGFISSETGAASSTGQGAVDGCKARIGRANAQGGVNGRKIEVEFVDDASSPDNLKNAQDLVQNRKVFAVINDSALAFFSYRYLVGAGVPVVGGGYDGNYYYDKGNESIFSGLGSASPVPGLTYDSGARLMKKLGGTKFGVVGYGISPSSSENAKAWYNYAAPAAGLDPTYLNNTVDFGSTDVGPVVLGIKNSGADAVYMPLNPETNFAIIQGLQQNGVQTKVTISATGYGQDLLDSPVAQVLKPTDVLLNSFRPIELGGKAVKQYMADRKKYAGVTGVPAFGDYTGYITCDIAVTGLEAAGKNPTRQGFIDGLRNAGQYDGAGLTCEPYDYSLANYGKIDPEACFWFTALKNGKFQVLNGGKPLTGKLVGNPALLAQYTGSSGSTTATTAKPAGS